MIFKFKETIIIIIEVV